MDALSPRLARETIPLPTMRFSSKLDFIAHFAVSTCATRVMEAAEKNPWLGEKQIAALQGITEEMGMNIVQACQALFESNIPCRDYCIAMRLAITPAHATITARNIATEFHAARAFKKYTHAKAPENPAFAPCAVDGKPNGLGNGFVNLVRYSDSLGLKVRPSPNKDARLRLVSVTARIARKTPVIQ